MYDLGLQFHFSHEQAKANPSAIIKGKNFRFTVLSERLIRIEYSSSGAFVDTPTQLVLCRNFAVPKFEVNQDSRFLELSTKYFKLAYTKESPITSSSLRVSLIGTEAMWYYGHPEIKTYDASLIAIDDKHDKYIKGIYSVEGFSCIDDSSSLLIDNNGNLVKKAVDTMDLYLFMYKDDIDLAIKDYINLTGKPQLLPRYALGNWWSKNYGYNEQTLDKLFNRFEKEEIPISSLLLDREWHITENRFITGYTFDKKLIPNPNLFIDKMHKRGIRVGLSINPIEGIHPHEEMYNKVLEYIKCEPNKAIRFMPFDPKFLDVFLKVLLHPLETIGIDYFWLDYPNKDSIAQYLMTHYMYLDSGRNEAKRSMLISRNPKIAAHRYGVLYSGRSKVSFDTLRKLPYINTSASNLGISWWSHDIGGFYGGMENGELYIRYIQLGCFSPIFRISVDKGRYYKRENKRSLGLSKSV